MNRMLSASLPRGSRAISGSFQQPSRPLPTAARLHQPQDQAPPTFAPSDYHHKSNLTTLPPNLKSALTSLLSSSDTITGPRIRAASLRIFDSLRSTTGSVNPRSSTTQQKIPSLINPDRHLTPHHVAYDHDTSFAYLAARFPACFTGIKRVLNEAINKTGGTGPRSVLDVGTGPGTAVWALRAVEMELAALRGENPGPAEVTAVDVNQNMLAVAKRLAAAGELHGQVEWAEYMPASLSASYDMSIAAYVFSELEDALLRQRLLKTMWRLTRNVLVLVDRGTPHGYQRMLEARDWFISQSAAAKEGEPTAAILAPCPHMAKCPLTNNGRDWCHFSQRMERPAETQRTKHAKTNLEDVKFSYLIVQKRAAPTSAPPLAAPAWPRVLSVPLKRGGHVLVDVCTPRGTADRMVVTKSLGKDTYKAARKLGWGDQWPFAAKVYVPGRGMGRGGEEKERQGEVKKVKKQGKAQVGGADKVAAQEQMAAEGVLFETDPKRPSSATVPKPLNVTPPSSSTEPPLTARGGRAARGSKKPLSPFAALIAQRQSSDATQDQAVPSQATAPSTTQTRE